MSRFGLKQPNGTDRRSGKMQNSKLGEMGQDIVDSRGRRVQNHGPRERKRASKGKAYSEMYRQ